MKYKVSWIINGELISEASTEEAAERNIEDQLSKLVEQNQDIFKNLGAIAIQGTATVVDSDKNKLN